MITSFQININKLIDLSNNTAVIALAEITNQDEISKYFSTIGVELEFNEILGVSKIANQIIEISNSNLSDYVSSISFQESDLPLFDILIDLSKRGG